MDEHKKKDRKNVFTDYILLCKMHLLIIFTCIIFNSHSMPITWIYIIIFINKKIIVFIHFLYPFLYPKEWIENIGTYTQWNNTQTLKIMK